MDRHRGQNLGSRTHKTVPQDRVVLEASREGSGCPEVVVRSGGHESREAQSRLLSPLWVAVRIELPHAAEGLGGKPLTHGQETSEGNWDLARVFGLQFRGVKRSRCTPLGARAMLGAACARGWGNR